MDPWYLIEAEKYNEAIEAVTASIQRDASIPGRTLRYGTRAMAYLNLGDFENALADFLKANQSAAYTSDGNLRLAGVAHWLAGRESEAIAIWQDLVLAMERGKIQYSDGAGGVRTACVLWFAGTRLGQQPLLEISERLLRKTVDAKGGRNWKIDNWPGPIAKFLLGEIDKQELRAAIDDVPVLRDRETCQVEFYIGAQALAMGDESLARQAFRDAAKLPVAKLEDEYYLAKHELKRFRI
jgi:hypothetical protein